MVRICRPSIHRDIPGKNYPLEANKLVKKGGNYGVCFTGKMNTKTKIKAPECLCGCGGRTKGGRFLPGHDAKLKKALVADARAGKKRAQNKLEKLGWSKFLEKEE